MTWAYFYFMKKESAHVREVAPRHAQYWRQTGSSERGGPFSDRSGGLILFEAPDEQTARKTIAEDPFQHARTIAFIVCSMRTHLVLARSPACRSSRLAEAMRSRRRPDLAKCSAGSNWAANA
jgi:uncharacterized protein YciI